MILSDSNGAAPTLPLSGTRVLDLSRLGPGPYCTALLVDLGAEAVRVERPHDDPTAGNPWLADARRRTARLGLELKTAAGREVLHRLVARTDVVIEGFRPGVAARLGADYATLSRLRRGLVYCSLSGYGQTGPARLRPGHDINYIAEAGLLGLSGSAAGPPTLPGALVADFATGALSAAAGIAAALVGRQRTGDGCHLDISMHETVAELMARYLVPYLAGGPPERRGSSFPTGASAAYNVYETRDGRYLAAGALEDSFFARLASLTGHPEWVGWRAAGEEGRLHDALAETFRTRDRDAWVELLTDEACISPVYAIEELPDEPQLRHRGFFTSRVDGEGRDALGLAPMVRGPDGQVPQPHPSTSGRGILSDWGFSETEIERLVKEGHAR